MRPSHIGSSPLARGLPHDCRPDRGRMGIIPARAGFTCEADQLHHQHGDHPRSRGVYSGPVSRRSGPEGSSPLARGLPPPRILCLAQYRIIPARAGFTGRSRITYGYREGSSPLARGLLHLGERGDDACRIIPARAGFTGPQRTLTRHEPDHPRSRGVYLMKYGLSILTAGSSPLARGLRLCRPEVWGRDRIIPARAGFTARPRPRAQPRTDHPRSRGVYSRDVSLENEQDGSSPLARGLHWAWK